MKTLDDLITSINTDLVKFILVALFSLLIGLEQRRHYIKDEFETRFGTDRTFTLIGIFGYVLYIISPQWLIPFLIGGVSIAILLSIFYIKKIELQKRFGITSMITALITYCLAPLVYTQPYSLVLLIVVTVLVLTEMKETFFQFSQKFDNTEFITLAKFLVIAGVILPMLPEEPISSEINISPYKFWLAIVAVSGISYFSYLLKKFVFPKAGIILTGILGGLYSSTATTFILARKSKELKGSEVTASIMLATTMMYLRIFLLALFFNSTIAWQLAPSFGIFILTSVVVSIYFLKFHKSKTDPSDQIESGNPHGNPLEFKTSFIFAGLFIFFALITGYVTKTYGSGGIKVLSFIVGVTDIDPFIINLFQSKWNLENGVLTMAVINAVTSNNLLKMIYGVALCDRSIRWQLITGFGILIIVGLITSIVFYF